jgi:hypothetical protein
VYLPPDESLMPLPRFFGGPTLWGPSRAVNSAEDVTAPPL